MKRRLVHLAFALASAALAVPAVLQAVRLQQAARINEAIARAADPAARPGDFAEARFAHALALARTGGYEAGLAAQKALVQQERGALRTAALYNLGNLHLRQALRKGQAAAVESLPLVELAKQSYRDALRADPGDWDARYNLERALALAPEIDAQAAEEKDPPVGKELTITTAPAMRTDLP
ncbi:MxaK protein [Ramlibacter sp. USB13]|uniref:MxaK protein n=1 Tax=Ramlibacter cellulosilyticus TaxID=2764187 RepID=A0A923MM91_9BURK|nr:MxaK protein [Ramlibacter cellulosilyticus]MBC5782207.1 MxaK protein [Ramlibacter cellulosilyticus]